MVQKPNRTMTYFDIINIFTYIYLYITKKIIKNYSTIKIKNKIFSLVITHKEDLKNPNHSILV